jgi:hypothetical protein
MSKAQPIGLSRKKVEKDAVEQLSFRIPALKKRKFLALLAGHGVEMKEVMIEFIDRYIEFEGNIGVLPLNESDYTSSGSPSRSDVVNRGKNLKDSL